jgi:hypothetical protein
VVVETTGPPAHAPAHGYRHKRRHQGHDLVFDLSLGAYAVVGWDGHFFHDGRFYRQASAGWELSVRLDGGWSPVELEHVPTRLARNVHRHAHQKKNKQRHHPAKHAQ